MLCKPGVQVRLRLLAKRHYAGYQRARRRRATERAGVVVVREKVRTVIAVIAIIARAVRGSDRTLKIPIPRWIRQKPGGTGGRSHEDVGSAAAVSGEQAAAPERRDRDGVRAFLQSL